MKLLRPIVLAIVLAAAFFYFTTWRSSPLRPANWISRPTKVEITEAAGGESLDPEEQNNIQVYRKNIPAVVNITSKAVRRITLQHALLAAGVDQHLQLLLGVHRSSADFGRQPIDVNARKCKAPA